MGYIILKGPLIFFPPHLFIWRSKKNITKPLQFYTVCNTPYPPWLNTRIFVNLPSAKQLEGVRYSMFLSSYFIHDKAWDTVTFQIQPPTLHESAESKKGTSTEVRKWHESVIALWCPLSRASSRIISAETQQARSIICEWGGRINICIEIIGIHVYYPVPLWHNLLLIPLYLILDCCVFIAAVSMPLQCLLLYPLN